MTTEDDDDDKVPDDLLEQARDLIEGWKAIDPNLVIDGLNLEDLETPLAKAENLLAEMEKILGKFRENYADLMDDVDELLDNQRSQFLQ